jgi:SAM-dependent MidA family methyltransferase
MTELEGIIRREIQARGPVSFARFMELALYHPKLGYYERGLRQTGRQGDFYTSVSVGSLFGQMLGREFSERLRLINARELAIIEAGAHDGALAGDLLAYLRDFQPDLFRRVNYFILEPSSFRARAQSQKLSAFDGKIRWAASWGEIGDFSGVCFSNELLDAMPVHVLRWNAAARDWTEWGVTTGDAQLEWTPLPSDSQSANARKLVARLPSELIEVMPDNFTIEISPEAVSWWLQAAHALQEGWLFTIDYGLLQEDFFAPQRADGTFRAYNKHHLSSGVLESAGDQDITAHVNFSLIIAAGESAGLKTEQFVDQSKFLKSVLERIDEDTSLFPLWTPMRYRELMSLMHPEHLGRAFKVLIQRRSSQ